MAEFRYKATGLIAREFDKVGLHYGTEKVHDIESLEVGLPIKNGPYVNLRFISSDDDNDVVCRIAPFLSLSAGKRQRMLVLCNEFNRKVRYAKLFLDDDDDLNLGYDIPSRRQTKPSGRFASRFICASAQFSPASLPTSQGFCMPMTGSLMRTPMMTSFQSFPR